MIAQMMQRLFGSRPPCPCGKRMYAVRRNVPIFVCECGVLKIGKNTMSLSPAGVGDVLRWSATQAAVAAGDIGMNVTTGRPSAFVGGVNSPLAVQSELGAIISFGATSLALNEFYTRWGNTGDAAETLSSPKTIITAPRAGTLKNMYLRRTIIAVNTVVIFVNGSATALTTTGSGTSESDLVNTVSVAQGDLIEAKATSVVGSAPSIIDLLLI